MDNMRQNDYLRRKSNARFNASVFRKRPFKSALKYVTNGLLAVNETASRAISGNSGSATAINNYIRSAAQNSFTVSLDIILAHTLVSQIFDICKAMSGDKILTVCRDNDLSFTTYINEYNKIGRNTSDTMTLRSELSLALQFGGTVIIRQILPFMTQQFTHSVEKQWVPWKKVYAFNLGNYMFEAVPKEHLNYASSIGSDGNPVSKEHGVMFSEYRMPARKKTDIPDKNLWH